MNEDRPPYGVPTPPPVPGAPGEFPPNPAVPGYAPPPAPAPEDSGGSGLAGAIFGGIFNWLIVPAGIVAILHFFVFQAFHVVGFSMYPTLGNGDYLIISKIDASFARLSKLVGKQGYYIPHRGEIIVFHFPGDPTVDFVKRVIAVPGDHVVVKDGKVTVFDKLHPDGFNPDVNHQIADPNTLGSVDEVVPEGKVFVLGDNRTPNGSYDSRDWGDLPSSYIIGRAILRLLPLQNMQILHTGDPALVK